MPQADPNRLRLRGPEAGEHDQRSSSFPPCPSPVSPSVLTGRVSATNSVAILIAWRWGNGGPKWPRASPLTWAVAVLSAAATTYVLAYPFSVVTYPPIVDLPFHAASSSILRHYWDPSFHFQEQFQLEFLKVPYWTQYLLGAGFATVLPIRIAVKLAPPGGPIGAYYSAPSEDFARPGTVWYLPGGRERMPVWSEITTAYHEGFPGHHLQIATQLFHRERLTRFQRLFADFTGYAEGGFPAHDEMTDETSIPLLGRDVVLLDEGFSLAPAALAQPRLQSLDDLRLL